MIATGVALALLMSGLLGSLGHCLGMCGPLVLMVGAQFQALTVWQKLARFLLYSVARITVYALFGLLAGLFGEFLTAGSNFSRLTGLVSLVLGAGVILFGLRYLGWISFGRVEGAFTWITPAMQKALRRGGIVGLVGLGALNGLLPCGLVYSALLVAVSTGNASGGALGMLLFGLGTVPALLLLGLGAGLVTVPTRQIFSRVAGLLIILVGVQLALRGLAGFELVQHLKIGGVMVY